MHTEQHAGPSGETPPIAPNGMDALVPLDELGGLAAHLGKPHKDLGSGALSMVTGYDKPKRKLPLQMEEELHAAICDNMPNALGLPYTFWTKEAVLRLVETRIGGSMPSRTMFTYLDRWGFTPTSPLQQAYREEPGLVRAWMRQEYPTIAMQAKVERAELMWLGTFNLDPKPATLRQERAQGSSLTKAPHLTRTHVLTFLMTNRHRYSWVVHDPRSSQAKITMLLDLVQKASIRPLMIIARDIPALRGILDETWCDSVRPRIQVRWMHMKSAPLPRRDIHTT